MFSSLRARLFSGFVLVIATVLVVSAVSLLIFVARSNLSVRVELRNTAVRMLQRSDFILNQLSATDTLVDRLAENTGYRVMIVDPAGKVVADSEDQESPGFPPVLRVPRDPLREVFTIKDLEGKDWLYTGRRSPSGYSLLILEVRQPLRDLLRSPITSELLSSLAQSGLVALVLSLLLAFLISRTVAAPLGQISLAARKLAVGQQITVQPRGPREVRVLGEAFNEMSAQVFASQQSQRDFVANVSHELKTPLTSVQGFAQAILDGTANTPEEQEQAAQVIFDEAGRMHRMVLDLLDLARLEAGTADFRRERVDLSVLLGAVIERFTPQSMQAGVSLIDQVSDLPALIGDGDWLSQVFNNLVDNAIKHTPQGGQVWISTAGSAGEVRVTVRDNGSGIPTEELSRIFERFYQTDKSRRRDPSHGAGLGLAIASQIVQGHGGRITAESMVGEGSKFTVVLPVAHSDESTFRMRAVE